MRFKRIMQKYEECRTIYQLKALIYFSLSKESSIIIINLINNSNNNFKIQKIKIKL